MTIVKCRACGTSKASGDICPGCGSGMSRELMRVRKSQPIGVFNQHGFHAAAVVTRTQATGRSRS